MSDDAPWVKSEQISVRVTKELYFEFKKACHQEMSQMATVLARLINDYLKQKGELDERREHDPISN